MIFARTMALILLFISLSVLGKGEKISEKSLRWILPADAWQESEGYLAKGYYFRISSDVGGRRYLGGVEGIKIYEEPELKGNFSIITYKWISDRSEERRVGKECRSRWST